VPPEVRRFLAASIDKVEELEMLLLVQRAPDRYWDADAIADHLGLRPSDVARSLEALAGKNFLDVRLGETIKYRYGPMTSVQRDALRQIQELWRDQRQQIVAQVASKRQALTDFSDAFRIGGSEDDDG
jgi:DNA-binding MarR family transcriptional regulator